MNSRQRRRKEAELHNALTPAQRKAIKDMIHTSMQEMGIAPSPAFPTEAERLKGQFGENCNRGMCQEPKSAFHYNESTKAYYCKSCAKEIQKAAGKDLVLFKGIHKEMYQS